MSDDRTLKQRIHDGDPINIGSASLQMSRDALEEKFSKDDCDLVFVDTQHSPFNEERLLSFCKTTSELGVPALVRIKHPRLAFLVGNYLDLGPLGVLVPMVEDEATVDEAIEAFYYPPIGKRSCGLMHAYGYHAIKDRVRYAEWWSKNGILMLQIESVRAVTNVRKLVKPGIDMLLFGASDLSFSLEAHPESPFESVEDCHRYVLEQTEGIDVRVGVGNMPLGRF